MPRPRVTSPVLRRKPVKGYIELYANIPGKGVRRTYWKTDREAREEEERIRREFYAGELTAEQQREARQALRILGEHSLTFAAQWFVDHYKPAVSHKVSLYVEEYLQKRKDRSGPTQASDRQWLGQFAAAFGDYRPEDLSAREVNAWLSSFPRSRWHRGTHVRSFLNWLEGNPKSRTPPLERPPLPQGFTRFIESEAQGGGTSRKEILSPEEARKVLDEAERQGCSGWVRWLLYTGMRPSGEAVRFWSLSDPWEYIHKDTVVVPREIEKTGKRSREIEVFPGLSSSVSVIQEAWKRGEMPPPGLRRRIEAVRAVLPNPKNEERNIFRHTFLSALFKVRGADQTMLQGATSMDMLRKHYVRHMSKEEAWELLGR